MKHYTRYRFADGARDGAVPALLLAGARERARRRASATGRLSQPVSLVGVDLAQHVYKASAGLGCLPDFLVPIWIQNRENLVYR